MAGLPVVAALLLVPVVVVRVAVSSLLGGWVDVAAILSLSALGHPALPECTAYLVGVGQLERGLFGIGKGCSDLGELRSWACYGGDGGSSQRAGRYNAPGEHAKGR